MATGSTAGDLNKAEPERSGSSQGNAKQAARIHKLAEVFSRVALGAGFLSAVADRFGLWGAPGKPGVAWGDFQHFTHYTGTVNSFLPTRVIPALAWGATIAETILGLALILGIYKRVMTLGSAVLLLMFALAMSISFGIKAPLDYSVFSASAAGFLLFAMQNGEARKERRG